MRYVIGTDRMMAYGQACHEYHYKFADTLEARLEMLDLGFSRGACLEATTRTDYYYRLLLYEQEDRK